MPDDVVPDDVVLPCGCVVRCAVVDGVNTVTVAPCRADCVNLQNALGLARDRDVTVSYRRGA